jgi:hypothetical protein
VTEIVQKVAVSTRFWLVIVLAIAGTGGGCASNHDLSEGQGVFGGGIQHKEIKPGLFEITVRTNYAPWSNVAAARRSWKKVADDVCGKDKFRELAVTEKAGDTGTPYEAGSNLSLHYIITERHGYALCANAAMTFDEANVVVVGQSSAE